MSHKQKARSIHDRIKEIAVKEGHKELLKLCRELDGIIQTLDDDEEGDNGDPGGNNPPTKPKVP